YLAQAGRGSAGLFGGHFARSSHSSFISGNLSSYQEYFNRNLSQISNIYRVSVVVMIIGFLLITIGIFAGFINGCPVFTPALVGVVAGVITEFIGATFLFMYRATIQQASEYMKTLE